jgi:hypothetical protein
MDPENDGFGEMMDLGKNFVIGTCFLEKKMTIDDSNKMYI